MEKVGRVYGKGIIGMPEITNITVNFEGAPFLTYEVDGREKISKIDGIKDSLTQIASATVHFVIEDGGQVAAVKGLTKKEINTLDEVFGIKNKEDLY
jgi:hypothetical protein